MNRFWRHYLAPMIDIIAPQHILEVGADRGWNTRHILEYCRNHAVHVDIVDPAPQSGLHDALAECGAADYRYLPLKSTDAIPQLVPPDVALIDGDHNWNTVYQELDLLHANAAQHGVAPPVVFSHDVGWPYGRRDMYYNPADLDDNERHPYAYKGVLPGVSELSEAGMNGMLANATHEGGPRNGVLTAIEDYIASLGAEQVTFRVLPFFNGLGMLVPNERMTRPLHDLIDSFFTADGLLEACKRIEEDSMRVRVLLQQTEACLGRRTEALVRARGVIEDQAKRLIELEGKKQSTTTTVE